MARVPQQFASELNRSLDDRIRTSGDSAVTVRRKLRTVLDRSGWARRTSQRMDSLQELLATQGVYPFPDLVDPDVGLDDFVRFSRHPGVDRPLDRIFGAESGLQTFIERYYDEIFNRIAGLSGLQLLGRQVSLGQFKVDLLFREPDGTRVVVEFKRADPALGAPNQVRRYIDVVRESGHSARGVLITAKPRTDRLQALISADIRAQSVAYPIDWYWYAVDVRLMAAGKDHSPHGSL